MDVLTWSSGKQMFGIRAGTANRWAHIHREWTEIELLSTARNGGFA
jgi:hypothetical protein